RTGDLSGNEGLTAARALVIEEDAVHRVHAVRLAIILRDVIRIGFRCGIRASRVEGGLLSLGRFYHLAVELARGGLVKFRLQTEAAHRLQNSDRAERGDLTRILGDIEADPDVALRSQIVDLVRADLVEQGRQGRRIVQIAVPELEPNIQPVRIAIQVLD